MDKQRVAGILNEIALYLELKGENPFKIRAYENGARIVQALEEDLETLIRENRLGTIKGIGKALEQKISELVMTGNLEYYQNLKAEFPPGLFDLFSIPGLGARKVRVLYDTLGIETIGELEYACKENRLIDLPGFGKKTQENILKGISHIRTASGKYLLHEAGSMALDILKELKDCPDVKSLSIAGSLRRSKEIIKDIDIVAASDEVESVMNFFVSLPGVADITGQGSTKTSVRLRGGIAVDLRVVSPEQYPYALHHFTGSREHNTRMRHIAKSMGMKMNEYGLFREENGSNIPCSNEADLFQALGMAYIPPELREDMGEIEAALENRLPKLVESSDLKGIFHFHSHYSDGSNSIKELADEVRRQGYQYIGISDHSRSAYYAGGLSEDDIIRQHEEIDELNKRYHDFYIFKGIESDILSDGSLDYSDEFLERFDFVIISIHSQFRMNRESMTKRILKAMDHPAGTILGHATGRLLLSRDGYEVDMEQILEKAAERGTALEINANPHRLDLDWRWVRRAKEMGIRLMINPDAHSVNEISHTGYGVAAARKGWCEKEDILNCLDIEGMKAFLYA
ncbi:MAG: DNA polymerase/3'-5' exonuclease PolX [Caldicoprobacterales bacterium]|jgi:DNA polymerase (family 10)|nr:DNA polymerase/3'-5' exonuclease PolX [Clostridiales bacterium]